MLRIGIVFCSLLALGYVIAKPVAENEVDLESWRAPAEIQKSFPYYLSGYDGNQRPIWVFEIGRYPLAAYVRKGPEILKTLTKYFDQTNHRVQKSIVAKNPNNTIPGIIADFEKFDLQQVTNPQVQSLLISLMTKLQGTEPAIVVLVNVNSLMESLIKLSKDIAAGQLDHATILGTKKDEWIPKLLKIFPSDQLPEWYGGKKNFKPMEIYGR